MIAKAACANRYCDRDGGRLQGSAPAVGGGSERRNRFCGFLLADKRQWKETLFGGQ